MHNGCINKMHKYQYSFHKVHLQCFKAVMEYAIEPMEMCLHKSSYTTRFFRIEEGVRITCYMYNV